MRSLILILFSDLLSCDVITLSDKSRKINVLWHYSKKHSGNSNFFWDEVGWEDWHFQRQMCTPMILVTPPCFESHLDLLGEEIMGNENINVHPFSLNLDGPAVKYWWNQPAEVISMSSAGWSHCILRFGAHPIFMTIWGYPKRQHWEVFKPRMIDSVCKYLLCQGFSLSIDGKWCIIN